MTESKRDTVCAICARGFRIGESALRTERGIVHVECAETTDQSAPEDK